jgi:rhomboid protease GlpG
MRQAGTIATKQDAERFANYLLSLGISSKVEPANGQWAVWIHDENQIPQSKQELDQFQLAPNDERYKAAEHAAKQARREAAEKQRQAKRNYIDMRNEWASPWRRRPVTMAMIIFSVLVYLGALGASQVDLYISTNDSLTEIANGQVWRLVTPIFLHFGLLHILFNMYWLYDLGTMIERRLGSWLYVLLILVVAVPSNFAQFVATGPGFGGMSGVVFGLFGYCWVRGRTDPTSGLHLRPDIAFWMLAWFALCLTPLIPNVANWAHGVGLAVGAALGYLPHLAKRLRQKT